MASVNRFTEARPAQDNYFNTFVPLPLEQLTALGMSRKQDLDKNQAMIDKAYNDVLNIQAIPGSKDETYLKTQVIPAMTDLAMKYSNVDLTQPQEMANLRREMRSKVEPNVINRIEQSHAGWLRYQQGVQRLSEEGRYNRQLDTAKPNLWDSANSGVFSSMPEAYMGKSTLFDPILKNLKPTETIDLKNRVLRASIHPNEVDRVAVANAADLVNTPQGQQELRLFKMNYPDVAQHYNNDDTQIMRHLINDYGADRVGGENLTPLPYEWLRSMYDSTTKATDSGVKNPLRVTGPGEVNSYSTFGQYNEEINKLKLEGNSEAAKDMEHKLNAVLDKYDLPKESGNALYKSSLQNFLENKIPEFVEKAGAWPRKVNTDDEFDTKVKTALHELSVTTSVKSSFGSPLFASKSMMDEDIATKRKTAPAEWADISNNMIVNPNNYEIKSINDEAPPKKKKLPDVLGKLDTGDMIDLSMGILPDAKNNYKPSVTMAYQNKKDGVTKVNLLINDSEQVRSFATLAAKRGDYEAEAAMNNPLVAAAIDRANFDTPQTYYIIGGQKEADGITAKPLPITIERNEQGGFKMSAPGGEPLDVNSRKEIIATIYSYMANNRNQQVPAGEPSSLFIEK